jgi:hypothetical protein
MNFTIINGIISLFTFFQVIIHILIIVANVSVFKDFEHYSPAININLTFVDCFQPIQTSPRWCRSVIRAKGKKTKSQI